MENTEKIAKYVKDIAINGSEIALGKLYNLYYYDLLHFSQLYVINENDAEEIVSDAFLDVWEKRKKLQDLNNFNAYIDSIGETVPS